MLSLELIANLTDDERAILLYILNNLNNCGVEIDSGTLKYYRFKYLAQYVFNARQVIKDEGLIIYNGLCEKLKIPIFEKPVDNTVKEDKVALA